MFHMDPNFMYISGGGSDGSFSWSSSSVVNDDGTITETMVDATTDGDGNVIYSRTEVRNLDADGMLTGGYEGTH